MSRSGAVRPCISSLVAACLRFSLSTHSAIGLVHPQRVDVKRQSTGLRSRRLAPRYLHHDSDEVKRMLPDQCIGQMCVPPQTPTSRLRLMPRVAQANRSLFRLHDQQANIVCNYTLTFTKSDGSIWSLYDVEGKIGDTFTAEDCASQGCDRKGFCADDCAKDGHSTGITEIRNQRGDIVAYGNCCADGGNTVVERRIQCNEKEAEEPGNNEADAVQVSDAARPITIENGGEVDTQQANTEATYLQSVVTIENVNAPGKYINEAGDGVVNGANIHLWDKRLKWRLQPVTNTTDTYAIESFNALGKYLNVEKNQATNGAKIHMWDNPDSPSTQWRLQPVAGATDTYTFENVNALGKYLSVEGNQATNGANIHLWDNASSTSTQWRIHQEQTADAEQPINTEEPSQLGASGWTPISPRHACELNEEGIWPISAASGHSLQTCMSSCYNTSACRAIDFYAGTGWCNFYNTSCKTPLLAKDGAASFVMDNLKDGANSWVMDDFAQPSAENLVGIGTNDDTFDVEPVCEQEVPSEQRIMLMPIVPQFHGSTALEGVFMSSTFISTLCSADVWQCEAHSIYEKKGRKLKDAWDMLETYSEYWNLSQQVYLDKGPRDLKKIRWERAELERERQYALPEGMKSLGIRDLTFVYVLMWRPVCLYKLSHNARDDVTRGPVRYARKEAELLEEMVEAHRYLTELGYSIIVLNLADLMWRPDRSIDRLSRFLPCLGSLNLDFVPELGKDVFPGNMWKAEGSVRQFGQAINPRDCCGYVPEERACYGEGNVFAKLDESTKERVRKSQEYLIMYS